MYLGCMVNVECRMCRFNSILQLLNLFTQSSEIKKHLINKETKFLFIPIVANLNSHRKNTKINKEDFANHIIWPPLPNGAHI